MRPHGRPVVIVLLAMLITATCLARADLRVAKIGDSLIDAKALTIQGGFGQCINGLSFQQDAIVTHGEHQYVAYYDANRRVCLARRELPQDRWKIIRFADYDFRSNDAHNTISMGVCPKDGTIHLAFDHHGHPLHYRVSRKGAADNPKDATWDASLFGPVISQLETGKPIRVKDHHYWRAGDGRWHHHELPPVAGNRPKVFMDRFDNAYVVYGTRRTSAKLADGHLHAAGDLAIAAATVASRWQDWKVIHVEKGPFVNEMLGDYHRWAKEGVPSVMVQQSPERAHQPTPLRILDFSFEQR